MRDDGRAAAVYIVICLRFTAAVHACAVSCARLRVALKKYRYLAFSPHDNPFALLFVIVSA